MSKSDELTPEEETADTSEAEEGTLVEWDEAPNNRKAPGERRTVSHREEKDDARKIVTGEAKYTADYAREFPDLAEAEIVRSDIAHGVVKDIDTSAAETMDGVYAVLTPDSPEVPDKLYTSAGQSYPEPSPWDIRVLRRKVRFVGDPIAAIAAEDKDTASKAARKLDVTYEEYDAVFDTAEAMAPDAPQIHDEDDVENIQPGADYERNIEAQATGEIGDVDTAFAEAADRADLTVTETEWETPYQSHCVPEPHTTIAHRDEDNRYHLISSTQVPYHTRRQLAHLFDVPIRDVRVSKPRIGAGFGSKQGMIIEPIAVALSEAADRPVMVETTRREQFHAVRNRRPARVKLRSVVTDDGDLRALDMEAITNSGAYGPHGMTVAISIGKKPLPLYTHTPNIRFRTTAVHTNLPIAGAMRGYGAPQGHLAVEGHMDEVARDLDIDPIELRAQNVVSEGDFEVASGILKDKEYGRRIRSCGLDECIAEGRAAIGWGDIEQPDEDHLHRACGMALTVQGSGVPGDELGAAHIKMNEDGSFILQTGAVDIGPGADTVMAQIAAEVLGVPPEDVLVQPSDTDISPFDHGAYASSTTYITGQAVKKAAEDAREMLFEFASRMLDEPESAFTVDAGSIVSEVSGESVSLEEIGYESVYGDEVRAHVMGEASYCTEESPPPFGAQFVDVTVNEETGEIEVNDMVYAVDCGTALNPDLVEGQIEGAVHMSYELATGDGITFDADGRPEVMGFRNYDMPTTADQPPIDSIIVETHEPTGPFGAKSVAEIPVNGVPPALSNAIRRAVGVRIGDMPITPEKIKTALDET
ncbi:xanthine dehydrogenase family protein molybdopterin-binding subunit [Halomarina pelagica]|uniref:xanthine dehydrogenase family protein molybdopterin-binding subunit n=1 Tax=Halomarina pelagica TaxID=2961599 RepID=UPI0020C4D28A|nr:molybdopterin cofactor-binding domain-containing protein [Halomarina sp. BND7]